MTYIHVEPAELHSCVLRHHTIIEGERVQGYQYQKPFVFVVCLSVLLALETVL